MQAASENFSPPSYSQKSASLVFPSRADTVCRDEQNGDRGAVRAVLPTSGGCAVFLGNNDKVFIIYVDQTVGSAITMFMREIFQGAPPYP